MENSALSKNSTDCLLNLLQLNLLGANASANNSNINSGLQYGDRVGIGGGGGGGGGGNGTALTKEQQQAIFYQSRGGGGVQQQQQQQQQKGSSGRAITNTGNLCNNFGQAQDIFSQSILNCGGGGGSGKLNKELGEYKGNQRGGSGQDINMGSQAKPFRNGGDGKFLTTICCLSFLLFLYIFVC